MSRATTKNLSESALLTFGIIYDGRLSFQKIPELVEQRHHVSNVATRLMLSQESREERIRSGMIRETRMRNALIWNIVRFLDNCLRLSM